MPLDSFVSVVETTLTVKEFVEGGALARILGEIGIAELEAAILCLNNISSAVDPRRELELAVGHLQTAHVAFSKRYSDTNPLAQGFYYDSIKASASNDHWVNLLMAVCYCYLGERGLALQSLKRAERASRWVDQHLMEGDFEFLGILNPMHLMPRAWDRSYKFLSWADFEKFSSRIRELLRT